MEEGEKCKSLSIYCIGHPQVLFGGGGGGSGGKEVLAACRVEHVDLEDWLIKHLLPTDRVVIELTTNAWHVYDLLEPLVAEVLVANPIKVKQIACARVKTDKKDTLILARLAGSQPGANGVGAAEACAGAAAVDLTPAADGGDAHPGGEPDAQCGPSTSSQPPEREGLSAEEHPLAAG